MSLKNQNGGLLDARHLPKLVDRGTFEGEVEFKFYPDAVEYAGACAHCTGVVAGLLRIADPALHRAVRSPREMVALQKQCAEIMRARHRCAVLHEGKTDTADWFKNMGIKS